MRDRDTAPAAAPDLVVVDAANVVGSRPDGWWRDRAGAARRLVDALRAAFGTAGDDAAPGEDVVVVLEGAARAGATPCADGRLRVVHAEGSGDDAIVAVVQQTLAADPCRGVTVVTSDRGLRGRVETLGARAHGPNWLRRRLG